MAKAGVVGFPVSHSLSPKLHGFWLNQYGIVGEYNAYEIAPDKLPEFIASLHNTDFHGVNLTIPHKEAVMKLLDDVDDLAKIVGAVNTLVIRDGKLRGMNTDVYGFAENIRPELRGTKKAVVLGAGGAAKAICKALIDYGFAEILVTNRTMERAMQLADDLGVAIKIAPWEKRAGCLEQADLLVNTTSLGLKNNPPLDIDLSALPSKALVTDAVYAPLVTPLLEQAQKRGNPTVDGLGMLLHQAVPAFEAWFGIKPEVTKELREYVLSS